MKFKRSMSGPPKNTEDAVGRVKVFVSLTGTNGLKLKGNVSRSITVAEARVSDVFPVIEKALFGDA